MLAGAACAGHDSAHRGSAPDPDAAAATASLDALAAAAPKSSDLPSRQQVIVVVSAIARVGTVQEVSGPSQRIYAQLPPGRRLHPPRFDITAIGVGISPSGRLTGCGDPTAATAPGRPRIADATPGTTAARLCHQRLGELGSQADGRFLLQTTNSPYVVVLYPYVEAFLASVRAVVTGGGFRAGREPGRFGSLVQPGCGLQFYAATAAAIGWCDDAAGHHGPDDDPTVAALGRALGGGRAQPAASGMVG